MTPSSSTSSARNPISYAELSGVSAAPKKSAAEAAQTKFLTILTAQLQHQDPMNPMDNAQLTSQIAQLNTVDGIERLNLAIQALTANASDTQAIQATSLIGKDVLVPGSSLTNTQGGDVGGVDLEAGADEVRVDIADANGFPIRTLQLGAQSAGIITFAWDGKADNGQMAAPGLYRMRAHASLGSERVGATTLEKDTVSSVTRGASGLAVNFQSGSISELNQVKRFI